MKLAIVFFDDLDKAVGRFVDRHLKHALVAVGKMQECQLKAVWYWDDPQLKNIRPESDVAREAHEWLTDKAGVSIFGDDRVVLVWDLQPRPGDPRSLSELEYGPRVLKELTEDCLSFPVSDFLGRPNVLNLLFSAFLEREGLDDVLTGAWGNVPQGLERIFKAAHADPTDAVKAASTTKPRVVVAHRSGRDDEWVAQVIAKWI